MPRASRVCAVHAVLELIERIKNQVYRHHLRQSAKRCAGASKAAVLGQFVYRRSAAAYREVLAIYSTRRDSRSNVAHHCRHRWAAAHVVERIGVDITNNEIVVVRMLEA